MPKKHKPEVIIKQLKDLKRKLEAIYRCKSAEGVAKFLRNRGIKGARDEPDSCPIANYLSDGFYANVSGEVELVMDTHPLFAVTVEENLTPAMDEFINKFDSGNYSYLEA